MNPSLVSRRLAPAWVVAIAFAVGVLAPLASAFEQFHGGEGHAGAASNDIVPANIAPRWVVNPASLAALNLTSFARDAQPVVSADGAVVFAVGHAPASKIVALDTRFGSVLWSADVVAAAGTISSPVYHRGYVYWAGSTGGDTTVYKINARSGRADAFPNQGWTRTIAGEGVLHASVTVTFDRVLVSTGGAGAASGKHYCLSIVDGSTVWSAADGGRGEGAIAYDADRQRVYQTINDAGTARLRAYNLADGSVAWTSTFGLGVDGQSGIAYANGRIALQDDTTVTCIDAETQAIIWSQPSPGTGANTGVPAIDAQGNVYAAGATATRGAVRAYSPQTGTTLWTSLEGGGAVGSVAFSGGYVFAGVQAGAANQNELLVLDHNDSGTVARRLTGSGPVAFGNRNLFTVGRDGFLYCYTTSSDYGTAVRAYVEGNDVDLDWTTGSAVPFNDPTTALGRPTVDTTGDGYAAPIADVVPVNQLFPAFRSHELVSVGHTGYLELEFDHPVTNDANNPHGIDFIVFGNPGMILDLGTFYYRDNPGLQFLGTGMFGADPGRVLVSANGTDWVEIASPRCDTMPVLGRVYDEVNPDPALGGWNAWFGSATDPTLPLPPTMTAADVGGSTLTHAIQAYGRSAGGNGYDISGTGLPFVRYVRIESISGMPVTDVDAIADVRIAADRSAPANPTGATQNRTGATTATVSWTNPADSDLALVVVVRNEGAAVSLVDGRSFLPGDGSFAFSADEVVYAGTATSFTDTGLDPAKQYRYTVFAADQVLNYSTGAIAPHPTAPPPSAASGCAAGGPADATFGLLLAFALLGLALIRRRV